MSIHIVSTRPEADARADCQFFIKHGLQAQPAPMLAIVPCNFAIRRQYDGVILTSRHAAPRLTKSPLINLPCFAVGRATAAAASKAGFSRIATAGGDGESLVRLLMEAKHATHKNLCWATAAVAGFDIKTTLEKQTDKTIDRLVVYEAKPISHFSSQVMAILQALKQQPASAPLIAPLIALVHSGRGAKQFRQTLESQQFADVIPHIALIAISADVAGLCGVGWHSMTIASYPRRAYMLLAAVRMAGTIRRHTEEATHV